LIVRRRFRFEAAHRLPHHPGKCRDLHGHSYELVVAVDRPVQAQSGMALDFSDLKRTVQGQIVEPLDHKLVNDLIDNPTAEVMAAWIWRRLSPVLPGLVELELHETRDCSVVYRGEEA
jgi:6-pyruvoyltetrahydropterin/6-carboxytetrahydropterin synthase